MSSYRVDSERVSTDGYRLITDRFSIDHHDAQPQIGTRVRYHYEASRQFRRILKRQRARPYHTRQYGRTAVCVIMPHAFAHTDTNWPHGHQTGNLSHNHTELHDRRQRPPPRWSIPTKSVRRHSHRFSLPSVCGLRTTYFFNGLDHWLSSSPSAGSATTISGWPLPRANMVASCALVSATSRV